MMPCTDDLIGGGVDQVPVVYILLVFKVGADCALLTFFAATLVKIYHRKQCKQPYLVPLAVQDFYNIVETQFVAMLFYCLAEYWYAKADKFITFAILTGAGFEERL